MITRRIEILVDLFDSEYITANQFEYLRLVIENKVRDTVFDISNNFFVQANEVEVK